MFNDVNHKDLFGFFEVVSAIPRGSGNESGIASYIESFAKDRGLYCYRDEVNNILVRKPATSAEMAEKPAVVLQAHTDMVCVSLPDSTHDFLKDPIELIREGDIIRANGTTLGADNGAAVALMLAILDSSEIAHPELECLFTVGEEVGMDGMIAFDTSLLKSRKMINLDSAGEGVATVSCAGGVRTDYTYVPESVDIPDGYSTYEVSISGFYGGHSGEDIALGRSNAIEATTRVMRIISAESSLLIASFTGGEKDNAIPGDCKATFAIPSSYNIADALEKAEAIIRGELVEDDSEFTLLCVLADDHDSYISASDSKKLVDTLSMLKSGPVMFSRSIENLVETSYNLSIVDASAEAIKVTLTARSSFDPALDDVLLKLNCLGRLAGFNVNSHGKYPGWKYDEISPVRDTYLAVYRELFGTEAVALGIHAGLECGLLKSRVPDMDIISIGPDIKDLHSPSETMTVSSFDRFYDIVTAMLKA